MDEKSIYNIARKIPDEEARDEYLKLACADDVDALNRIRELLAENIDGSSFLQSPSFDLGETQQFEAQSSRIGRQIGPFKILQEIGEGGMGSVFMAEQEKPVRRRVAIKIIKPGKADKQLVARFEAERQALAMMDHQNIAKVLDAGQSDDGSPYLVMELIQGIPITKYCDQNKLTPIERLKLFVPLCKAIQHAHQKGILHRDLKPANVLVCIQDGNAVPKVIDFGLAKPLQHQVKLTDKTMFTEFGQVLGTVRYMSPEQAVLDALDVDTRSDIYSLGIILYELLSGSTPLDQDTLKQNALLKVLSIIRESDPPRPSIRLASSKEKLTAISEQRHIQPSRLEQILRDELDWVVMKALEKDRTRRYESVNDFALDIERYLNGDAVIARPPSILYRTSKYVRKHRGFFATATSIACLLIIAVFVIVWERWEAARLRMEERVTSTLDSLEAGSGKAIPIILENMDSLPSKFLHSDLRERFSVSTGQQKLGFAYGLANFGKVEIDTILDGLINGETKTDEVDNIVVALSNSRTDSLKKLKANSAIATSENDWIDKTKLAIVALHLGDESLAAEMLVDGPEKHGQPFDPVQRTVFIREFPKWSGSVGKLVEVLSDTDNPALRSGICLSLGGVERPSVEAKEKWKPVLVKWYLDAADSGTHSAAGWTISRWNLDPPAIDATKTPPGDRHWWQKTNGLTFVKIDSGMVTGELGPVVVRDDYWLSDSEITVELFRQFMTDKKYHAIQPDLKPDWDGPSVLGDNDAPDLPVQNVSWYDTVLFCNWLSWELGLEPCYDIMKSTETKGEPYQVTWRKEADGIRLPTSAEWEYACRASTTTHFSFGNNEQDLSSYSWFGSFSNRRTHPVRRKLSNAWGLFDMHGNVCELCWHHLESPSGRPLMAYHGGSWLSPGLMCESSFGMGSSPTDRSHQMGFRVACGPVSQASQANE